MIFKFFKQDKTLAVEPVPTSVDGEAAPIPAQVETPPAAAPVAPAISAPSPPALPQIATRVAAAELRHSTDPAAWGGLGSDGLEPLDLVSGHEAALADLDIAITAAADAAGGFVLLPADSVLGPALAARLEEMARRLRPEPDWVYVVDPATSRRLQALILPRGHASLFQETLTAAIDELRGTIPAVLSSAEHDLRRRTIAEEVRLACESRVEELRKRAQSQNVALLRTPSGFALAPIHEGKTVRTEIFALLPPPMQREVEVRVGALEQELAALLDENATAERERRRRLDELDRETVAPRVAAVLTSVRSAFPADEAVAGHLAAIEWQITHDPAVFLELQDRRAPVSLSYGHADCASPRRFLPQIAVTAGDADASAPVVAATPLTSRRLTGTCTGMSVTPGFLHAACGGILLVDSRDLQADAEARGALLRAVRSRLVEPAVVADGAASPSTFAIDPLPFTARVIVAGDRSTLRGLRRSDPEFDALFPVMCDLARPLPRTAETEAETARHIAGLVHEESALPLDASALARLVEECARLAPDRDRLVPGAGRIRELVGEAAVRARRAGDDVATRKHVTEAAGARSARGNETPADWTWPATPPGSVVTMASPSVPALVSAHLARGRGRPGGIVRTWPGLAAPDRSRSAVLWSLLAARCGTGAEIALAAVIACDQSLQAEDPATAAAEACALLLGLARVDTVETLAVLGGIGADGRLHDVADINERIEGLHVALRAGTGSPPAGVVVPRASLGRLMLAEDVVASVAAGDFAVYAAGHVDEVLTLLTGEPAGAADDSGHYAGASINGRIALRLAAFAIGSVPPDATPTLANGAAAP